MLYAITFSLFALALGWTAVQHGGIAYALLWPALSFAVVASGYAGLGATVFGKTPIGQRSLWATALLLPYLAFSWLIWSLRRWIISDACSHQIVPGIWLGRRPYVHELPQGVACVVDLTCEFTAASGIADIDEYICLPVLDTCVPPRNAFVDLAKRVANHPGTIYVHCAAGHGRSAMFVVALLMARGIARNSQEAQEVIRKVRPAIRLSPQQRCLLEQVQDQLRPDLRSTAAQT